MNMKEVVKTTLNLVIICLCVGACLSLVDQITKGPIKENQIKKINKNRQDLIPADEYIDLFSDEKHKLSESVQNSLKSSGVASFVKALKDNKETGYVVQAQSDGYSSRIDIMYGISPEFELLGVKILSSAETPGLGENIKDNKFLDEFKNKDILAIQLTKDDPASGKIEALTGATISSRAVTEGIFKSLKAIKENLGEGSSAGSIKKAFKPEFSQSKKLGINMNPFGSTVSAHEKQIHPVLKELLPADNYKQVMTGGYAAVKDGKRIGFVVQSSADGHETPVIVGFALDSDFRIIKVEVIKQQDTPGYGEKATHPDYLNQFVGKTLEQLRFSRRADSDGSINAVTGATITCKAVFEAVKTGIEKLKSAVKE